MARLSRVESQERTREQLVATARELFLRDGYGVTSLSDVAERAGYSKGAVYSNFRSKGHLCLAVLDAIRAEQLALLTEAVLRDAGADDRLAAFAAWGEAHIGDETWTLLEVEFLIGARHDAELRGEITARVTAIREALAQLLEALAGELGASLAMPAEQAAMTLLSLGIGLGVQRVADPAVPTAVLTDTLRLVLRLSR
ncbi:TetR/AcrR family transcriptional regulator [Streptomyces sp. NPDC001388]|uniref:TetR/AcrR family transcriptional regulator n=1 Tax=unclassified Streptomyces TaxID=2593676 RepID=UPI0036B62AD6